MPNESPGRPGTTIEGGRRVLIVANPGAGARHRQEVIAALETALCQRGFDAQIITDLPELDAIAERHAATGLLHSVVAAGGDGTFAELANRTPPGTPLSVFPLGTCNLLAGYLRLPSQPNAFAEMLASGTVVELDAAQANGRIFVLLASAGFDADVVERIHFRRAGSNSTIWKWIPPICDSLRRYPYPLLRIYCHEELDGPSTATIAARWAFVVNLPCYAGGLKMAPSATATDGLLDVSTFRRGSLWHALRYLPLLIWGRPERSADHRAARARRIRIEADQNVPYELDGDPGGHLPLEIEVLPGRLTVVCSAKRAQELTRQAAGRRGEPVSASASQKRTED